MKCVSYVRRNSCFVDDYCRYHTAAREKCGEKRPYYGCGKDKISQQETHIQKYAAELGWDITDTYRDEEGADSFEQLKDAGISRKFDCVITDSLFRFGGDFPSGAGLLEEVFFPAGIHFAVAEDRFCSVGKSRDEVRDYIQTKRSYLAGEYSWIKQRQTEREGILTTKQCRYGYRLNEDATALVVNQEEAEAVREMYRLYLACGSQKKVTDAAIAAGYPLPKSGAWSPRTVMRILTNPVYKGEAAHVVDGVESTLYTEPIVTEDVFRAVQEKYEKNRKKHFRNPSGSTVPVNFLSGRIHDAETGEEFCCMADGERRVFVRKKGHRYLTKEEAKTAIPADALMEIVKDALRREKDDALKAAFFLNSGKGDLNKQELLQPFSQEAQALVSELDVLCLARMEGEDAGGRFEEIEESFPRIMDGAKEIETAYGRKNPWILLFRDIEIPEVLERKHIKKWVGDVRITDMQAVEVWMNEQAWKDLLPVEWFHPHIYQIHDDMGGDEINGEEEPEE